MQAFFDRLLAVVVSSIIKALSEPGVLTGLVDAWLGVMRERQIKASGANDEDKRFVDGAVADGWGAERVRGE